VEGNIQIKNSTNLLEEIKCLKSPKRLKCMTAFSLGLSIGSFLRETAECFAHLSHV